MLKIFLSKALQISTANSLNYMAEKTYESLCTLFSSRGE